MFNCLPMFTGASLPMFTCLPVFTYVYICGIAGENRPTGAKFPIEIIDL